MATDRALAGATGEEPETESPAPSQMHAMESSMLSESVDESWAVGPRHGALLQPELDDWVLLESSYMAHWSNKRHQTSGDPRQRRHEDMPDWRMRERLRTVTAALVMCLNIGVDPPDVSKTNPCSKLICWMDPESLDASKALPAIGRNLQVQFETLSMKTRYKQYLDPIVEETKRFCTNLRRTAKDERVLFYYNGYGVPKPTPGGEIWVFNKAYTQYIPLTLYDLQAWLGSPCIYVWDTSASGHIVNHFRRMSEMCAEEEIKMALAEGREPPPMPNADGITTDATGEQHFSLRESIHLAACGADEVLPMNPDLPADLFTCCLTSPIEISLRWFVLQNPLPSRLNVDMVMNIPGRLQDRRTPLGELNWILTAVTDTIAWTVLPRALFRRFFRDDLMVAALLRNYLLAERIMRFYHCTPVSHPRLPPTHNHPLWDSWDLAVDQCLAQLPTLLAKEQARIDAENGGPPIPPHLAAFEYRHSSFFSEQLKAFEVWLSQGDVSRRPPRRHVRRHPVVRLSDDVPYDTSHRSEQDDNDDDDDEPTVHDPPSQLPIVLQVLLSQVHRLRALILLSQFLDLGPWAVNLALSIGIFPYVLKLLQSPAADLKPVLIYIWARILAVDHSCQVDLLRDNGYMYFASVLSPFPNNGPAWAGPTNGLPIPNVSEHRAMCAFILAVFCQDFPLGQEACLSTDIMDMCLEHLEDDDFLLRQWSALCLAQLWDHSPVGKARALARDAHGKLCCLLSDASPEVRAAMLYALGVLLGTDGGALDVAESSGAQRERNGPRTPCIGTGGQTGLAPERQRSIEVGIAVAVLSSVCDCSPLVRKELVITLSALVHRYHSFFVLAAYLYFSREATTRDGIVLPRVSADVDERVRLEEELVAAVFTGVADRGEPFATSDVTQVPAFVTLFVALLNLSVDAHPEVANLACTVVDHVLARLVDQGLLRARGSAFENATSEQLATSYTVPTALARPANATGRPETSEMPVRHGTLARTMRVFSTLAGSTPPPSPMPAPSAEPVPVAAPRTPTYEAAATYTPPVVAARPPEPRSASVDALAAYAPVRRSDASLADLLAQVMAKDLRVLRLREASDESMPSAPSALPLKSRFFAWCSEYYTEPQMKAREADEPGSRSHNRQAWRRQRCEQHMAEAMEPVDKASLRTVQRTRTLMLPGAPTQLLFHEYDPYIVTASDGDLVCVYDWQEGRRLSSFHNGNHAGSDITALTFVNEEVDALLLAGSADGDVRLYRHYDRPAGTRHGPELVSAFRALPDLLRSKHPSGLRVVWQQVSGRLLAGGDARLVRLWDAHRELCIADVPTRVNSCATAMTCDRDIGHLFMAAFGDGSLGVYDQRNPPSSSLVRLWEEHAAWVHELHLQKHGARELVSASVDGEVRVWDIRARSSVLQSTMPVDQGALSSLAVHERLPVSALVGAPSPVGPAFSHTTWLYRLRDLTPLGSPYVRTLHPPALSPGGLRRTRDWWAVPPSRFALSTSRAVFHPHEALLAVGGPDAAVELLRYE
ncbi:Target of rapamycin complex 1 subunit kog1 [Malassezia nana]|uniref:Target of rapamycin complex 1 subunit kog1 n=1 Tax=Malassezia nana TaxID=180528 RepID=A0AAF0ENB3_9BASI|nr:Target of rapamycin complex 1 subunit kog1 [Malassezia nana]